MSVNPIRPEDVEKAKEVKIPDEVFEAFNEAIVESWDGHSSTVRQNEVIALIKGKLGLEATSFNYRWLDIEPIYRKYGWDVKYDKPGYNEDYEPSFKFSKPRERQISPELGSL